MPMISAYEFRDRWFHGDDPEPLVVFQPESLVGVAIPDDSKAFLCSGGLPQSAAPYLDFAAPEDGPPQTVAELWQLSPEYNCYRVLGSNGSGDPVCIDESRDGEAVYLNHDHNFLRVLINSSVPQLAESLLAFRHLVQETQRRNGEDAYLDDDVPDDLQQWLLTEIIRIDAAAANANCFWSHELECIRDNAT